MYIFSFTLKCLALSSLLWTVSVSLITAEQHSDAGQALLVLDASGSMWGRMEGTEKIAIARDVVGDVLADWNPDIPLGLMAYGHRNKGDCNDIELVRPVAPLDAAAFSDAVNSIVPRGKTPITQSLFQAAKALRHVEERASVILVSDGLETCDSDPCIMAALLEDSGVDFTVHVVGFGVTEEEARQLQCIADNTGGLYLSAETASGLTDALSQTVVALAEPEPEPAPEPEPVAPTVPDQIAKLDLDGLSFDVVTFDKNADSKVVATGTSNGVGWTIVANNIYKPLSNIDGGASFNNLPGRYDDLHMGSDFTLTFDRPVTSLLVVLANDNDTGDGPNFQNLTPRDFIDASAPNGGSQVRIDDPGGALFYYYGLDGSPLVHINDNGINDGWDLAFFAFPKAGN